MNPDPEQRRTSHEQLQRTKANRLQSQIIAALNDRLRKYGIGGRIVMTQGIAALQQSEIYDIVQAIRSFDSFTEENDPHAEHDFGFVQIAQHSVLEN